MRQKYPRKSKKRHHTRFGTLVDPHVNVMNQNQFGIPKQMDESLLAALGRIKADLQDITGLFVQVNAHDGAPQPIEINDGDPSVSESINYVVSQHSEIMPYFALMQKAQPHSKSVVTIRRMPGEITDEVTVNWGDWAAKFSQPHGSQVYVRTMASARKHLRAVDVEAGLTGGTDTAWTRYRDAQQTILNSLQETAKSLLVESHRRIADAEAAALKKFADREQELIGKHDEERLILEGEYIARGKTLDLREEAIKKREESFNTKESRYVARQGQSKQIEDINQWLKGWSLTKGTNIKWWTVAGVYIAAIIIMGILTFWLSRQSVEIIKANELAKIAWWQWTLLSLKSILPLAVFTTLLVYFIRWTSAWANQHADEEFRNRARLLDIGRSSWLLEAVRDAHESKAEIPPELLKELAKNLFTYSTGADPSQLYPQALTDLLKEGIGSIRVKTQNAEVEAKSGKEK